MAKYLLFNQSNDKWRLPNDTSVDGLRRKIVEAMESGSVLEIEVIPTMSRKSTMLLFNGKAVKAAVVIEG